MPKPAFFPEARPQTLLNYAMPPYSSTGHAPANGMRSHNQLSLPYPGALNSATSRLRPGVAVTQPGIYFKPSPFYDPQYQVGDIKTLEGASGVMLLSPLR